MRVRLPAVVAAFLMVVAACGSGGVDESRPQEPTGAVDGEAASTAEVENGSASEPSEPVEPPAVAEAVAANQCLSAPSQSRVDIRSDGNRVSDLSIDLANATAVDVELPADPTWIISDVGEGRGWYVVLDDGSAVRIDDAGQVSAAEAPPATPPVIASDGSFVSPFEKHDWFGDPLTDGRVVEADGLVVALASPTDRLAHGVLGDAIEASAIEWIDSCTETSGRIEIPEPDVVEGTAPLIADIDDDDEPEILVTLSNSSVGARLAAFELDGSLLAESLPIGTGNRWRNQLAVGPFGPGGETEVIDVRTPHIGGTVQAFQLVDGALERVAASQDRYTSHVIRSRNLDMGIALDANVDGRLDVVVATADRNNLVGLTRTDDAWAIVAERSLDGRLTTNIAVRETPTGTQMAAGRSGAIRIFSTGS